MNDRNEYIGSPEIHDGKIISLIKENDNLVVNIQSYEGKNFVIKFINIKEIKSNNPENMVLYGLVKENFKENLKKYIFSNWDEDGNQFLEIIAEGYETMKTNT